MYIIYISRESSHAGVPPIRQFDVCCITRIRAHVRDTQRVKEPDTITQQTRNSELTTEIPLDITG